MNARERFDATMHFRPRDRSPIMDFGFWEETLVLWEAQGYPSGANPDLIFGMDKQWNTAPIDCGLRPSFGFTVLEDRGDTRLVRDGEGVTKIEGKFLGSIPQHVSHALTDRESWDREFAHRFDGSDPGRYPDNWAALAAEYRRPDRDYPLGITIGSLYGWVRNWMGLEGVSLLVHDDLPLFERIVNTLADCTIATITPALEQGVRFEFAQLWEDMCFRNGPLLSPKLFKSIMVPAYKRITSLLRQYGTDVVIVDCDGDITKLAGLWLEAGVNTLFPIEVGTWGADPLWFRAEYGRDALMIGGVSKRILSGPKDGITREVHRLAPLVEEGGYIPTPDHRVPPDVPLENYLHYLEIARSVWGKDAPTLTPMQLDRIKSPCVEAL